jgi:hypothetical protein
MSIPRFVHLLFVLVGGLYARKWVATFGHSIQGVEATYLCRSYDLVVPLLGVDALVKPPQLVAHRVLLWQDVTVHAVFAPW